MNLPNKLTILRICMIPVFVVAYFLPFDWAPIVAVAVFALAAFTDFLDGHIARKYNLVTDLGKLLDPIADKILVTAALFCVVATNPLQYMSTLWSGAATDFSWLTFGTIFLAVCATIILARELLVDAVRMIAASKGIVVQANVFGKVKTVLQDISLPIIVLLSICRIYIPQSYRAPEHIAWFVIGIVAIVLFAAATLMTILSGVIYLVQNKSVFSQKENSAKME